MSELPTDTPTKSFNAEAFALNLARAMESGGKALTAFLSPSFSVANTIARKLNPILAGSRLARYPVMAPLCSSARTRR